MVASPDTGTAREKLADISATVRAMAEQYREHRQFIADQLREQRASQERMEERLTSEIKNVRSEQRQETTAQGGNLELLKLQVRDLSTQARAISEELGDISQKVDMTTSDIIEMKGLRQHIMGYGAGALAIIAIIAWFIGPFFSSLALNIINKVAK